MNNRDIMIEKNRLFEDVYYGHVPKRVPILSSGDNSFCLEYAGFDLRKEQFSIEKNLEAIDITTKDFETDSIFATMVRIPQMYKMLGARNFVMGSDGLMQHLEIASLHEDDYEDFIQDCYKTICDKALPRMYTEFGKDGFQGKAAFAKGFFTFYSAMAQLGEGYIKIAEKHGKAIYNMANVAVCTPFDMLADQLRSFTGISKDLRRRPEAVEAACEALLPCAIKAGTKPNSSRVQRTFIPLHMAPYMRTKDFERFYWPTFKKYVEALDELGIGTNVFVEHDWSRYYDYLYELPENTLLIIEEGDFKEIKKKLGGKHILSGFYPLNVLKTGTEEECLNMAKELIEILAPGGKYIFALNKNLLTMRDINPENLKSVICYVKKEAVYS
ncbi:MAG: uroporphyrinogen decarboxylase [Eubacteriaceae bacterium]|jgi:hypothetical protein|nr:uroporphyrinogen decarboxylase [Eubacteriaceae bacterium]